MLMTSATIVAITLGAVWHAGACGLVAHSDGSCVTNEPMMSQGLLPTAILRACTALHGANWHPLTSFSHMVIRPRIKFAGDVR